MNTRRRTTWGLIASVFLAASTATIALAQTGSGSLSGYVTDSQGGRLPGVTITATSPALIGSAVAVTDGEGYYRVIHLPPGTYEITAELAGFATLRRGGILLRAGVNFQVNAELGVAGVSETVTVQAESPMLEVASPSTALNVEGDFQRELPLQGRRLWSDFLEVTPGVLQVPFDDGSGRMVYYSHGTMHNAHVTELDGMLAAGYNDMQLAKLAMPTDLISDTQVKSGGIGASDPTTNSMVLNIITKSGGNSLSGSAAYNLQPFAWNGDNTGEGATPTISQVNQLDLSIGGPIVHDQVWFFGAFRYADYEIGLSRTEQQVNNLQSYFPDKELFNNTSNAKYPYAKITSRLGNNHTLTGLYQYDRTTLTRNLQYHYDPIRFEQFGGSMFGGKLVSVFGSDVTTNFTVSYNNKGGADHGTFGGLDLSGPSTVIHPGAFEQAGRVIGTGRILEGGNVSNLRLEPSSLLMVRGDLSWFKGSHTVEAGFFVMRGSFDRITQYSNGGFSLEEVHAVDPNNPSLGTIPFHRQYQSPDSVTAVASVDRDMGIYLQDSWKPTSRLTVNAGLRGDFVNRHDSVFNIDRMNSVGVAPRVGFSLLLTDDATTVLRGSYGRFYEQLVGYDGVTLFGTNSRVSTRDEYSTDGFQTVSSVVESPAVVAELADYEIDPDLSEPFVDEFIVGIRKQFPGQFSVDVSGIHRIFKDGFGLVDVNGIYPDGPNQPFIGFERIDPNRGILYQETNNTWATTKYTAIEVTATKNLSDNLQFVAGFHRQWQHLSGTWNPSDPARFIQPDAFPNNKHPWGTFWNNDSNSLAEGGASISYAPMWRPYSARLAGTWFAPRGIVVAGSYTLVSGPYNGHVLDLLPENDPELEIFGPPTVVSSTGVSQPNPLATRVRFAFPTRSEGQTKLPGIHTVGLKIGKTFRVTEFGEVEVSGNIFNLLNADHFHQYSYNGPNRLFSPGYLEPFNQQGARVFQLSVAYRW